MTTPPDGSYRTSELIYLALALCGPLRAGAIERQLEAWGYYYLDNNVAAALFRLARLGRLTRDAGGVYTLGPSAPRWASLMAASGVVQRAAWRAEMQAQHTDEFPPAG